MGALLSIRHGVPSKLPASSADAVPRDGADRLPGGGSLPVGGAGSAPDQLAVAGSVSTGRDLRAWFTERHRTAGSATGSDVRETLSASSKSPPGPSSGTRTALSVH